MTTAPKALQMPVGSYVIANSTSLKRTLLASAVVDSFLGLLTLVSIWPFVLRSALRRCSQNQLQHPTATSRTPPKHLFETMKTLRFSLVTSVVKLMPVPDGLCGTDGATPMAILTFAKTVIKSSQDQLRSVNTLALATFRQNPNL